MQLLFIGVYWLIFVVPDLKGGEGEEGGGETLDLVLMSRGDFPKRKKKEGKRKRKNKRMVTDKIILTAYVVWFITSAKDYRRYSFTLADIQLHHSHTHIYIYRADDFNRL